MDQETEKTLLGGGADAAAAEETLLGGAVEKSEEVKPAGDKPGVEVKPEVKPESQVPERYEYSFENADAVDAKVVEAFSGLAKDLGLSNEAANHTLGKLVGVVAQRQNEKIEAIKQDWANNAKTDKEFGGEAFSENLAMAKKAMVSFASPALVQYMNESGLGNHPEIIRLFYKVGKSISEDVFVNGKEPTAARTAQSIYDKSNMNP